MSHRWGSVEPAAERAGFERAGVNHTCSLEVTRLFAIENALAEPSVARPRHTPSARRAAKNGLASALVVGKHLGARMGCASTRCARAARCGRHARVIAPSGVCDQRCDRQRCVWKRFRIAIWSARERVTDARQQAKRAGRRSVPRARDSAVESCSHYSTDPLNLWLSRPIRRLLARSSSERAVGSPSEGIQARSSWTPPPHSREQPPWRAASGWPSRRARRSPSNAAAATGTAARAPGLERIVR
jgi:hypothetical protein